MRIQTLLPITLMLGIGVGASSAFAALAAVEERTQAPVMQVQPTSSSTERVSLSREPESSNELLQDHPTLNLLSKIDFLQQEVQELRGRLEEQAYQLEQMHKRQKDLYLDLDKRLRAQGPNKVGGVSSISLSESEELTKGTLKGGADQRLSAQIVSLDALAQPSSLDVNNAPLSESDKANERRVYEAAYRFIQSKDFDKAEDALRSQLKSYPTGEYAPNAHYWLGELYLVDGKLDLAQTQFESVFQKYPGHQKAADALLKMGYVQYAKGQWQRSSQLLGQVKTQFPDTTSARLADSRLEKMRKEGRI